MIIHNSEIIKIIMIISNTNLYTFQIITICDKMQMSSQTKQHVCKSTEGSMGMCLYTADTNT